MNFNSFQLSATDADGGSDGRIRYLIKSGNDDSLFHLDENNGTLTIIQPLDYETQTQHILNIVAMDSPTRDQPFQDERQQELEEGVNMETQAMRAEYCQLCIF